MYGRGWLVRNRWREKGYEVLEGRQWLREQEHGRECGQEHRPKVVVLRAKHVAKVSLDTTPAGYRLTREAVAAVLAVFAEFDPKGGHSYIINEQLAVIRHVPVWRAEEVAAALVRIALGSSVAATGDSGVSATGEFPQLDVFGEAGPAAGLKPKPPISADSAGSVPTRPSKPVL